MEDNLMKRIYANFRGADFRGDEINLVRSPDCLNVWKDYKSTESIRTRPEMELLRSFSDRIYGVFFYTEKYNSYEKDIVLVHSGTTLYKANIHYETRVHDDRTMQVPVVDGEAIVLKTGVNAAKSDSFVFEDVWYFKDGMHYLEYGWYDAEGNQNFSIRDVVGYVPVMSIGRKPGGGGTDHEDANYLTPRRINTFLGDGVSTEYLLSHLKIDQNFIPIVRILNNRGEWESSGIRYTVNYEEGKITFIEAPPEPFTDGQDNVSIEFSKTIDKYNTIIQKCTLLQVFDNRVFFGGNPDYPNVVYHCSLNDPSYCSDTDYYNEGTDKARVKGMVAGNNALWVFREPSQANTTVFYHTPTIDDEHGKIYPNTHSSVTTGCIGAAINFNDDIVFFSERGMEGISGDITTEQVLGHRSSLVDRKMIAEANYENMCLAEWEGYLLVFVGNKVYLADSRAVFTNEDHYEYEWFYWELQKDITCATVNKGVLYLGTADGVYTLTDTESAVESYWTTPKDKFQYPQKLKTTNKRGCVVEATGDISIYAKLEDTDFEPIGTYENVTDYFVSRIKMKKFKDLQLKFYSPTRFSLETATIEAFLGGYIKR